MKEKNSFSAFQAKKYFLAFWSIVLAIITLTIALISTSTLAATKNGQEESASYQGVKATYYEYGDTKNPPVVITGGWPWTSSNLVNQAKDLAGRGLHVIRYDPRGSGDSDKPQANKDDSNYGLPALAGEFGAVIDKAAPKQKVSLVGEAWGPFIASEYASEHPGRISSLTSIGTPSFDLASRDLAKANQGIVTNPASIPAVASQDVNLAYIAGISVNHILQLLGPTGIPTKFMNQLSLALAGDYKDILKNPDWTNNYPTNKADFSSGINKYRWIFYHKMVNPSHNRTNLPIPHVHVYQATQDSIETPILTQSLSKETPDLKTDNIDANHLTVFSQDNLNKIDKSAADYAHQYK